MKSFKKIIGFSLFLVVMLGALSLTALANGTLTVAGNATIKTVPDIGYVTFSIKTFDYDIKISQEENNRAIQLSPYMKTYG